MQFRPLQESEFGMPNMNRVTQTTQPYNLMIPNFMQTM